jgi:hypothetical protein
VKTLVNIPQLWPRPRSTQTDHHAEIKIGANPTPFPTVKHHATIKSTKNRGKLWRTKNRGESTEKEKKKKKKRKREKEIVKNERKEKKKKKT